MIIDALRGLGAVLCNAIYPLIAILYDLFMKVSRVELLTSDYIQPIYQRITMILTIVMVFYVTFEMVKFVVEPDNFSNKDKGAPKIVLRMVLVVILIAFVPKIFGIAYQVQNKIFDTQIFSKVILGTSETKTDQLGKNLSRNILNMFYYVDDESFTTKELEKEDNCDKMPCKQLVAINLGKLQQDGRLPLLSSGLSSKGDYVEPTTGEKVKKYYIEFNWLFAVAVGGFIAYILLLYCIDVGVRVVQLLYLQIIAPIPILGYLSPKKDGIFEKWTKQCVTTYLDLFIRTGIIYFILLICEILGKGFMDGKFDSETLGGTSVFIVLVMGLLLFAHKMPKMLGELFPKMGAAAGNFGLKAGERVAPEAARAIGAGLGGANRLIKGGIARARNTHNRNKEIREKRRAAGKDTSWRAVNQERRQALKNERHARRQNFKSGLNRRAEELQTTQERNAVLKAEKELAEAKRRGNKTDISTATEKLAKANSNLDRRKAEISAQRELDRATKTQDQVAIDAARKKLETIREDKMRQSSAENAIKNADARQRDLDAASKERAEKDAAVKTAQDALEKAKQGTDQNAIAEAEKNLKDAMQARDNNLDIYNQEQIIGTKQEEISKAEELIKQKESEKAQNNQSVTAATDKHNAATAQVTAAQAKLADATTQGDKEIDMAQTLLDDARNKGDTAQEKLAQEALNQAIFNKNLAVTKAQSELKSAQANQTQTQDELNQATQTRDAKNAILDNEIRTATQAKDSATQAKDSAIQAKQTAIDIRDKELEILKRRNEQATDWKKAKIEAANKTNEVVQEYKDNTKKEYEANQAELARAESERAEIQNQRYRSTIASGVSGAIGGATRGIKSGITATKLEDISKKIEEGNKKDNEVIAAREKWLDSGGTTNISKIKSSIDKNIGGMTDAQVSEMEIKRYDSQISTNKRLSAIEGAVKTNVDNAKSRSGSKLEAGEQKTKVSLKAGEEIKYKTIDGKTETLFKASDGVKETRQIYQDEKDKTIKAREKAQAAQQAYANAKAQGNVSETRLKELEQEADNASKTATIKEQELGQKKKALEEYAITHVLQQSPQDRRNIAIEPDQALVEQVENSLQSIEASKRNADTYNRMMKKLPSEYIEAYRTGDIRDYDTLDAIQTALTTIKAERDRETSTLETMAGILKSSNKLDAEKAADGSSGK